MRKGTTESDAPSNDNEEKSGFSLPPITLPSITLPQLNFAQISFSLPYPQRPRGTKSYVLASIAIDSLDIIASIAGFHDVIRAIIGSFLSIIVFGPIGILYMWEAIPLLLSFSSLTLVPTAVLLAIITQRINKENS